MQIGGDSFPHFGMEEVAHVFFGFNAFADESGAHFQQRSVDEAD